MVAGAKTFVRFPGARQHTPTRTGAIKNAGAPVFGRGNVGPVGTTSIDDNAELRIANSELWSSPLLFAILNLFVTLR